MEEKKYKHMTLEDRIEIQECLNKGINFKDIGKRIGKDPTTISKEVKKHLVIHTNGFTTLDECCPKQTITQQTIPCQNRTKSLTKSND